MLTTTENPRILIYSHNTRGFGHASRSLALSWALYHNMSNSSILYCGASLHELSALLPPNADYVKLPSFDAVPEIGYLKIVPAKLRIDSEQQYEIRTGILKSIAHTYRPQVLLADFYPRGKKGELQDVIDYMLTKADHKMYLGFRDIIFENEKTKEFLNSEHSALIKYDRIFIYGDPDIFDFNKHYEVTNELQARMIYTGYVSRNSENDNSALIRSELGVGPDSRFVLCGAGGGKDSGVIFEVLARLIKITSDFPENIFWLVVAGPLIRDSQWEELSQSVKGSRVKLIKYLPNLKEVIKACDIYIGTCGYNTAAEILTSGTKAIFLPLPRADEKEQLMRATVLSELNISQMVIPEDGSEYILKNLLEDWLVNNIEPKKKLLYKLEGDEFVANTILKDLGYSLWQ